MPSDPSNSGLKPGFHPPTRTATIGMNLFLAALFMLFASGLLGYIMIRVAAANKLALGSLQIPAALWISTAIVVLASITIHLAVRDLRRERQRSFRRWLILTMLLAIAFVIVQAPSMVILLKRQQVLREQKIALYALVFVLILLHALHVLGGIGAMAWTTKRAADGAYDHENYHPVSRVALYWHFLDLVWLAMFLTFELVR